MELERRNYDLIRPDNREDRRSGYPYKASGDHIANVDYVIYVRDRKCIMPYKIDNNLWDIDIKKRGVKKTFMSHFNLDIEDPVIKEAFKDELKDLDEFKKYIETHLKAPIMDQIKEKRGLNPYIPPSETITIRRD